MADTSYHSLILSSPIGNLKINLTFTAVLSVEFTSPGAKPTKPNTPFDKEVANQFKHYFKNPHYSFHLPLALEQTGTPFQHRVWQALKDIPCGKAYTYGELAQTLKTGARAIGNACRTNPFPIVIPCHRVIGKNHLGGYMGKTNGKEINIKSWLLSYEGFASY